MSRYPLFAACLLAGAAIDFVFNGVFKIVWLVIYGPAYLVAAKVLMTRLSRTPWERHTRQAVIAFFAGAFACHLASVGYHRNVTYLMSQLSDSPITLKSEDWPQRLVVSSGKLAEALARRPSREGIPVVSEAIVDYGCYRSFTVSTVAGVDVQLDPGASWTWRMEGHQPAPEGSGPGTEDRGLPWCRLKFYRGTK